MRWGVRDEATDDHLSTDLCLQEIDNCQRLSVGPNFCVSHYLAPPATMASYIIRHVLPSNDNTV